MKLQTKVTFIIALAWIVICALIFADAKLIVTRDYQRLENQLIKKDIQDAQKAYDRMLFTLILYSQAFSQWDDAYHFMKNKNKKFINSNFVSGTFSSSHINFMMYFDNLHQFYYGRAFDLSKNLLLPIPDSLIKYLKNNPNFLSHQSTTDNKIGILNTSNGLIVMSSLPILTSTGLGPSRGSLLIGYYLTNYEFNNLSQIIGMKVKFFPISAIASDSLIKNAFQELNFQKSQSYIFLNNKIAYGFILLSDINNIPVGVLRIEIPRYVYLQGLSTRYHYFTIVIMLGLLVMLLTWYLLKIFVLDRVISISNQVTKINTNRHYNQMLSVTGHDELNSMVNSINCMMKIISSSRDQLFYMATHDDLTQLPNRKLFYDILSQEIIKAKKNQQKFAIFFLDLDKFKNINDQYGHAVGDNLLQILTTRIINSIRQTDILARQSGDEFLVLLKNIQGIDYVIEYAKRIIQSIATVFKIDSLEITITISIGIAIYPDDGTNVEELLKHADQVMYVAKTIPGSCYKFYGKNYGLETIT